MSLIYNGSEVLFEDDPLTGKVMVSTKRHGDLGSLWQESNGVYSARVGALTVRHIGTAIEAYRWIVENQQP